MNLKTVAKQLTIPLAVCLIGAVQANELDTQIKAASGKAEAPTAGKDELQAFENKLETVFNGGNVDDWQKLQMQQMNHQHYLTLQEQPAAKQERGFFAVRPHTEGNRLLQAPHADSDLYTGKIATRLFLEGGFKAAQWNTVKRNVSDMAHTPDTYWQAFTRVFAKLYPDGKIIQLHGYDQDKRKTEAGESSGMIVSAGHKAPPAWVRQTAACLKSAFSKRVSLYPVDVTELGGTTNVQGQLLRSLGHDGFLHIEMSKALRKELLENAESRKQFLNCL